MAKSLEETWSTQHKASQEIKRQNASAQLGAHGHNNSALGTYSGVPKCLAYVLVWESLCIISGWGNTYGSKSTLKPVFHYWWKHTSITELSASWAPTWILPAPRRSSQSRGLFRTTPGAGAGCISSCPSSPLHSASESSDSTSLSLSCRLGVIPWPGVRAHTKATSGLKLCWNRRARISSAESPVAS